MKSRKMFYPLKASDLNFVICKNLQMTKSQIFKISPSKCLVASVRQEVRLSTQDDSLQGIRESTRPECHLVAKDKIIKSVTCDR